MILPLPIANLAVDYFEKGGPIMWPILLLFLIAIAVVLQRAIWWSTLWKRCNAEALRASLNAITAGQFQEAIDRSNDTRDPFLHTIHDGIMHAHNSLLGAMQLTASRELESAEKYQWVLGTLITLAPLMGLLGTITGIMRSFSFVGDEQLAPSKVSGGIAEALIATACGLIIAMLCLIPFNYFNRRIAQLRGRLEQTINHAELLVASARHHGHDLEAFALHRAMHSEVVR